MASKPAQLSLNEQQDDEAKTLIVKKIEIQKLINQTKIILKGHHDANLKHKKSYRRKNPQMAQLEQRLSKLKADLKEVDHAISEKGSTTKSVEVEQKPQQDSANEIAIIQKRNTIAPEETVKAEATSFVSKDEDLVIRQPCRKCNGFIEKILDDNMRFLKLSNDLNNQLDQMNKLYKNCLLENANKDELLKTKDQLLVIEKEKTQTYEKYDRLNKIKENHEGVIKDLQEKIVAQEKLIKAQDKVIEDKDKVHQRFVDCSGRVTLFPRN